MKKVFFKMDVKPSIVNSRYYEYILPETTNLIKTLIKNEINYFLNNVKKKQQNSEQHNLFNKVLL